MRRLIVSMLLTTQIVSGCASLGTTTGIEVPLAQNSKDQGRLSLCELVPRWKLQYGRQDTEQTKRQLDDVLTTYDATC